MRYLLSYIDLDNVYLVCSRLLLFDLCLNILARIKAHIQISSTYNKARYTATYVARGWAGAVMKRVNHAFKLEQ